MKGIQKICAYDSALTRRAQRERAMATAMLMGALRSYGSSFLVRFLPTRARRAP